jgi:thiol-disulfide isomerase/thioredoxin
VKAKLILLDFWASWCKPCRLEHPAMVQLYQKYKSSGMTIFSVSIDEEAGRWFDAVQEDKLMWPNHVNEIDGLKGVSCTSYYINEIPNNYLIDSNGIVVARNLHGQALQEFVAKYFNK